MGWASSCDGMDNKPRLSAEVDYRIGRSSHNGYAVYFGSSLVLSPRRREVFFSIAMISLVSTVVSGVFSVVISILIGQQPTLVRLSSLWKERSSDWLLRVVPLQPNTFCSSAASSVLRLSLFFS